MHYVKTVCLELRVAKLKSLTYRQCSHSTGLYSLGLIFLAPICLSKIADSCVGTTDYYKTENLSALSENCM